MPPLSSTGAAAKPLSAREAAVPLVGAPSRAAAWSTRQSSRNAAWSRPLRRAAIAAPGAPPAAASGAAPPQDVVAQPQLQAAAVEQLEPQSLDVEVEFVAEVEGYCTLRTRGRLSGLEAQKAAVLAAALVHLKRRELALNGAVQAAREQFPGALDPKLLERFDRMRASGRGDAGLAMLGFGALHELCSRVAPEECKEVEEEIVAAAIQMQSRWLEPPQAGAAGASTAAAGTPAAAAISGGTDSSNSGSSSSSSSSPGSDFTLPSWYDMPTKVAQLDQWQRWVRRLRDEVVAWQQRQGSSGAATSAAAAVAQPEPVGSSAAKAAAADRPLPAAAAVAASQPALEDSTAAAAAQPAAVGATASGAGAAVPRRGVLTALFSTRCTTPDGLAMRQEVVVRVQPPEGKRLVQAMEQGGMAGLASRGYGLVSSDPGLKAIADTPELQLQHALEVEAFGSVQLPQNTLCFTCTFHGLEQAAAEGTAAGATAAAAEPRGSGGGGGANSAGGSFEFDGSATELSVLIKVLSYMVGEDSENQSPPGKPRWFPFDGRIRFQKRSTAGRGQLPLPWGGPPPAAEDGWSYLLQVQGDSMGSSPGAAGAAAAAAAEPREVELSQRQLDALLDCLDAFMAQHPGYVELPPLPPLELPPRWHERVANSLLDRLGWDA